MKALKLVFFVFFFLCSPANFDSLLVDLFYLGDMDLCSLNYGSNGSTLADKLGACSRETVEL